AGIAIGNYFVEYALSPSSSSGEREINENTEINLADESSNIIAANKKAEQQKGAEFELTVSDASITSKDNLTLKGKYRKQQSGSLWAIIIHGYKSSNTKMMDFGAEYYNRGYNVLLPNNRAHGDSQGDYIGMGWLDKDDIILWIDWIKQQDSQAKILIHGVSMGGATAMMLSGSNPKGVIGYINDCGYTTVWEIFESELYKRFSLPAFPVLHISELVASVKAGYNFKEASAINAVKSCNKPILFIHGNRDDFVPIKMGYETYEAANCVKEMYVVEKAGHAEAKDYNPKAYWEKVFDFINSNMLNGET
ncbi:MAG: alpha/beta hydrolase, partial [Lachnospiraceae bacterium]|nr:alpha/beta hydrolase [Lachnospiraceae bacterium]